MDKWLTTQQAAERLQLTDSRVRQLILEGRLPAQKFGHLNMIREDDLPLVAGIKRGERALVLCMPITGKRRIEGENTNDEPETYTAFAYKPRWFVLSQTEGEEIQTPQIPEFDLTRALATLNIERIPFDLMDGNCQGYARRRQVAVNPVAQLPTKTLLHEVAHVLLGHTVEADFTDSERTPKNLREVEAEAVALVCCESLNLEGADYCRGYIQHWLQGDIIPEQSAQRIFRAANEILRAGREQVATEQPNEN